MNSGNNNNKYVIHNYFETITIVSKKQVKIVDEEIEITGVNLLITRDFHECK